MKRENSAVFFTFFFPYIYIFFKNKSITHTTGLVNVQTEEEESQIGALYHIYKGREKN